MISTFCGLLLPSVEICNFFIEILHWFELFCSISQNLQECREFCKNVEDFAGLYIIFQHFTAFPRVLIRYFTVYHTEGFWIQNSLQWRVIKHAPVISVLIGCCLETRIANISRFSDKTMFSKVRFAHWFRTLGKLICEEKTVKILVT